MVYAGLYVFIHAREIKGCIERALPALQASLYELPSLRYPTLDKKCKEECTDSSRQ